MKKFASLLFVAIVGGGVTLGAYKLLEDESKTEVSNLTTSPHFNTVAYEGRPISSTNADFTEAA